MELQHARAVVEALAQGIHPVTGVPIEPGSAANDPQVVRALFTVLRALDGAPAQGGAAEAGTPAGSSRPVPAHRGQRWSAQDDAKLDAAFTAGADLKPLADELGRSTFALEARLVKLGRLPPRSGMRFAAERAAEPGAAEAAHAP